MVHCVTQQQPISNNSGLHVPEENQDKTLLKIIDLQGRVVDKPETIGVYIYFYDDFSTDKKIKLFNH